MAFRVAAASGPTDHRDVQRERVPPGLILAPDAWAAEIFAVAGAPLPVRTLFALRQALVPLIGVARTADDPFTVREVCDGQALMVAAERHLTFWCSVRTAPGALEMATAVRLNGWRGRVYWLPVGILHGPVTRAMLRRAVARRAREAAAAS